MKFNRAESMKSAWGVAKIKVGANPMDDKVREYFKRLEAADNCGGELSGRRAESVCQSAKAQKSVRAPISILSIAASAEEE